MKVSELGTVAKVKVADIKPYEKNPRRIPDRAVEIVAESIRLFGWQQPLVVDSQLVLIVGHVRWQAAKRLKLRQVPVVVADQLTDDEIRAYRIADNRTHDFATWDYDGLGEELSLLSTDYGAVLALEDWAGSDLGDYTIDVPADVRADAEGGFPVTLTFEDKSAAMAAEEYLIDVEGVLDVRYQV